MVIANSLPLTLNPTMGKMDWNPCPFVVGSIQTSPNVDLTAKTRRCHMIYWKRSKRECTQHLAKTRTRSQHLHRLRSRPSQIRGSMAGLSGLVQCGAKAARPPKKSQYVSSLLFSSHESAHRERAEVDHQAQPSTRSVSCHDFRFLSFSSNLTSSAVIKKSWRRQYSFLSRLFELILNRRVKSIDI